MPLPLLAASSYVRELPLSTSYLLLVLFYHYYTISISLCCQCHRPCISARRPATRQAGTHLVYLWSRVERERGGRRGGVRTCLISLPSCYGRRVRELGVIGAARTSTLHSTPLPNGRQKKAQESRGGEGLVTCARTAAWRAQPRRVAQSPPEGGICIVVRLYGVAKRPCRM
jgi:hypothetical protein